MIQQAYIDKLKTYFSSVPGVIGVCIGGAHAHGLSDAYSDIDIVIVCANDQEKAIRDHGRQHAAAMGEVLSFFVGTHIGEPRLDIMVFASPLQHVDIKYVSLTDFRYRIEDPMVVWAADDSIRQIIADYPCTPLTFKQQFSEDRFWVWLLYGARKLRRGEWQDVIETLSYIRQFVLGPGLLQLHGHQARGVRRIEQVATSFELAELRATLGGYSYQELKSALLATARLYDYIRQGYDAQIKNERIREAVIAYINEDQ